jgi:hypothetical protein
MIMALFYARFGVAFIFACHRVFTVSPALPGTWHTLEVGDYRREFCFALVIMVTIHRAAPTALLAQAAMVPLLLAVFPKL